MNTADADAATTLLAKLLSREHAHVEVFPGETTVLLYVNHFAKITDAERGLLRRLGVHEIRVR